MPPFARKDDAPRPEMFQLFPGAFEIVGEAPTDWLAPVRAAARAVRRRLATPRV